MNIVIRVDEEVYTAILRYRAAWQARGGRCLTMGEALRYMLGMKYEPPKPRRRSNLY